MLLVRATVGAIFLEPMGTLHTFAAAEATLEHQRKAYGLGPSLLTNLSQKEELDIENFITTAVQAVLPSIGKEGCTILALTAWGLCGSHEVCQCLS